jgi:hypothetical protein
MTSSRRLHQEPLARWEGLPKSVHLIHTIAKASVLKMALRRGVMIGGIECQSWKMQELHSLNNLITLSNSSDMAMEKLH